MLLLLLIDIQTNGQLKRWMDGWMDGQTDIETNIV